MNELKSKLCYFFQVGDFHSGEMNTPTYIPNVNIDWPGHYKPTDEPHCGYDGNKCESPHGLSNYLASIFGGIY